MVTDDGHDSLQRRRAAGLDDAERAGDGARQEGRVADRCQGDERDAVGALRGSTASRH